MLIPVRCFTCGKIVASLYEEYKKRVFINSEDPKQVLDDLGITRYCCRRTIISHPSYIKEGDVKEPIDEASQYE